MNTEEGEESKQETPHHKKLELCMTRPAYRQGRKFTSVKVYTVSSESQHLFVYGVPSINLRSELKSLFNKYGELVTIHVVPQQKVEIFTECYHVHYKRIQSARIAKRLIDTKSFYGGILHVCYAPEYETLEETAIKLQQRRKDVLVRLNKYNSETNRTNEVVPTEAALKPQQSNKRKHSSFDVPPIYNEEDPILSLKKKQKKNTEENLAKYSSQSYDLNGGLNDGINNSRVKCSKKFVPLPLRHQSNAEVPVYGPQLPKYKNVGNTDNNKAQEAFDKVNHQSFNTVNNNIIRDMRKICNVEKRIIFRNKIQNKIS